jgi:hypothetical protein
MVLPASDSTPTDPPPPTLSFSAADSSVTSAGSTILSWTAIDADSCSASGGWSGIKSTSGNESVGPLSGDATFTLSCTGPSGSASAAVSVSVTPIPEPDPEPVPTVTFTSSSSSVDSGQSATLSWSTSNASSCQAADGWSGGRPLSGSESTGAITSSTTFSLTCAGPGGSVSRSETVAVNAAPAPTVTFNAADSLIDSGASTLLTWSASNTSGCTASGGWTGNRASSGSESIGPLTARSTFSLSCTGSGGTAIAMVSVSVNGSLALNWVAPVENVDGSPLTDLAGYRVYYGDSSRSYTGMTDIDDPASTTTTIAVPSGDYFVAMTALDAQGNESAYSNEALKTAP